MAIQRVPLRIKERSGYNYKCDLCGKSFIYKGEANEHHHTLHISDKAVLDAYLSKWYVEREKLGGARYSYVLKIDYQSNRVTMFVIDIHQGISRIHAEITMTYNTMLIDEFKNRYICGQHFPYMIPQDWRETTYEEVYNALKRVTDNLFINLSTHGCD